MSVLLPYAKSPITGELFPSPLHPRGMPPGALRWPDAVGAAATTFRSNYQPPPPAFSRQRSIDPPAPASVIHKNGCFLRLYGSQTQNTYTYRPPARMNSKEKVSGSERMYATNFQIVADRRLDSHRTTARDGFWSHPVQGEKPVLPQRTADSAPLGNRAHTHPIHSEYCNAFTSLQPVHGKGRANAGHHSSTTRNTVTGQTSGRSGADIIASGWEGTRTTHCDTYRGEPLQGSNPLSHTARMQQLRITSIPQGDPSRMVHLNTHLQDSFRAPPSSSRPTTYNKTEAVRAINKVSIHLSDNSSSPNEHFSTTATHTYRRPNNPGRIVPIIRFPRNASSLSQGDLEPSRMCRRLNHTTTGTVHREPPSCSYPKHVDGSNLHTLSFVHLGGTPFYRYSTCGSTMSESYPPISAPTVRVRAPEKGNIPLNYCAGHLCRSTTAASYPSYRGVKMDRLNPEALRNLKSSHWQQPSVGHSSYSTTHRESFRAPPA